MLSILRNDIAELAPIDSEACQDPDRRIINLAHHRFCRLCEAQSLIRSCRSSTSPTSNLKGMSSPIER